MAPLRFIVALSCANGAAALRLKHLNPLYYIKSEEPYPRPSRRRAAATSATPPRRVKSPPRRRRDAAAVPPQRRATPLSRRYLIEFYARGADQCIDMEKPVRALEKKLKVRVLKWDVWQDSSAYPPRRRSLASTVAASTQSPRPGRGVAAISSEKLSA